MNVIFRYLELMDKQREDLFARIGDIESFQLWKRPGLDSWSMGEHLDHTRVLLRSFRHILAFLWPLLSPYGRLRRNRPYPEDIDDVYQRAGFPLKVGWLWSPRHSAKSPVPAEALHKKLMVEHQAVSDFYKAKKIDIMGNTYLYDPVVGRLNYIQALRTGVYHDEHHYQLALKIFDRLKRYG